MLTFYHLSLCFNALLINVKFLYLPKIMFNKIRVIG